MITAATAFAICALAAAALTPVIRNLAVHRGLLDHALTSRKIHGRPVPRLGGVAIVIAFFIPLVALLFVDSGVGRLFRAEPLDVAGLFAGGLMIAALGVYDDLRGAGAHKKFAVQMTVGALMYAAGYRIDEVSLPFGETIDLGLLALPFTMLWFSGVINAMNLIDGLDGLAGGVAFIAVGTTFTIAALQGDPLMMLVCAALAGSVLGFLVYNFNPASIFMGDTGSMFLGFALAAAALQANQKSSTAVALLAPILTLGLPIGDTLLAMARRAVRGRPMFQADREHIHHLLLARGWSHRRACLTLYGVAGLLGASAVALSRLAGSWRALLVLVPLASAAALFLRWLGYGRIEKVPEVVQMRRRNLELRAAIRRAGERLRQAAEPRQVWQEVQATAPALGASCVGLTLPQRGRATRFSAGFDEADSSLFRARYSVTPERAAEAHIELGWTDGRGAMDRDTEIAVELLCEHVAEAVERLDGRGADVLPLRRGA